MDITEKIYRLWKKNEPFALATVVKTTGSAPGKTGFKMLVEKNGAAAGTVGGGFLEQDVLKECLSRMKSGESGVKEYILDEKKDGVQMGPDQIIAPMICGGGVWIYFEVSRPPAQALIFGAGHVGSALSRILAPLDYRVTLIDNRREFADEKKNPLAKTVLSDYREFAESLDTGPRSFAAIMTHGHEHDYEILSSLMKKKDPSAYIGVIASKAKSKAMIRKLKKELGPDVDLSRLYTPIGLDIGGNSASEIALGIAAEIQAARYGRKNSHMRDAVKEG
jgi:xanthine dehydrogenase accessory factor